MKNLFIPSLFFIALFFSINTNAQTGNVGIGTTTPSEKLDVNGNFRDSTFSTTWTPSIAYDSNYVVIYEGNIYRHLTTSNTATTPDIDDTNWENISSTATTHESGEYTLPYNYYLISGTVDTWVDVDDFTIPNAGVWKIHYIVRSNTVGDVDCSAAIKRGGSVVNGSAIRLSRSGGSFVEGTGTGIIEVTTSGAETFTLVGRRGGNSTVNIASHVNGETKIYWEKVAGRLPVVQDMSSNTDVDLTPHTQQATIADGAALRYNSSTGKWEADTVEGFADDDVAFTTPWGFELKMYQGGQQGYIRNSSGVIKFFSKMSDYARVVDQVSNTSHGVGNSPTMSDGWITVWTDTSLNMDDIGDYERMRFTWADSAAAMAAGNYEEYEVTMVVGPGYDNNYFRVRKLK